MLEQWTLRRLAEWQLAAACLRPQLDQAVDRSHRAGGRSRVGTPNPVADGPGLERSRRAPVLATQRASGGRRGARRGATGTGRADRIGGIRLPKLDCALSLSASVRIRT